MNPVGAGCLGGLILGTVAAIVRIRDSLTGRDRWTCPFCQSSLPPRVLVCRKCGRDLPPLKR
jgi:hypothetical protein